MNELINMLSKSGYAVEYELSSGSHGTCYLVRKNNICYILKNYESNSEIESRHEADVYSDLHGKGKGSEYFFKAEHTEIDGKHFLLSQTYEGTTLERYFKSSPNISISEKLNILISACKAIREMHNSNPSYAHFDIKPSNLYLSNIEHIVKPIDMGSAVTIGTHKDFNAIMSNSGYKSTDNYSTMRIRLFNNIRDEYYNLDTSPAEQKELCEMESNIGIKDDIYSLICCAYYVFTGKKFKFWIDEDIQFYNDIDEIRTSLINANVPDYLLERMTEIFALLIGPYMDESAEVPYASVDEFINELIIMKEIEQNDGFHAEILFRNFKKYFRSNLKMLVDADNGYDENLVAEIKQVEKEDINDLL